MKSATGRGLSNDPPPDNPLAGKSSNDLASTFEYQDVNAALVIEDDFRVFVGVDRYMMVKIGELDVIRFHGYCPPVY